jgi:hypothetical protein
MPVIITCSDNIKRPVGGDGCRLKQKNKILSLEMQQREEELGVRIAGEMSSIRCPYSDKGMCPWHRP